MRNRLERVHILDVVETTYGVAFVHPRDTIMYLSDIQRFCKNGELIAKLPKGHHDFTLLRYDDGTMNINSVCGEYLSSYLAQPDKTWKREI